MSRKWRNWYQNEVDEETKGADSRDKMKVRFSEAFLSVRLFVFSYDVSKNDAATISKLDIEMFHHESWKPIYFGVKRSKVKITRQQKSASVFRWNAYVSYTALLTTYRFIYE